MAQIDMDSHDITFTIPAIAVLDIEPDNLPVIFQLLPPNEAGAPVAFSGGVLNNQKWLNYSSAIAPFAPSRNIHVQLTGGNLPAGIELSVMAAPHTGIGAGAFGNPNGQVSLTGTAKMLVSGIGGCYTGDGIGNGHLIIYSATLTDTSSSDLSQQFTVEITYTISD